MVKLPEYIEEKVWTGEYPKEIPEEVQIPETNMAAFTRERAEKFRDRTALIFRDEKFSYAKLLDFISRFADALADIGIGKDDTVAILMANSPEWVVAYRGAMETGARITGISLLFAPREIMYQLNDSDATAIVLHERFYPNLEEVLGDTDLENVIVAKLGGGTPGVEEGGDVYHHGIS